MKNKAGRIIELVLLIAGALATIAVLIAIPLKSYNEYADYLAWIEEINKPQIKPVLESISVELKEGVKYFKNDLAEPKASDFVVKANYTLDGVPYSEDVEEGKFNISTKNDFYSVGGDVTVTYKNKTAVFTVELIPVQLESISILKQPYKVRYQTGSTFDAEGMVLCAVYNDGSTKTIAADKYAVDTKELAPADNAVTVRYTEGDITKTVAVSITVSDVLDDGAVVAIVLTGDAIAQSGSQLSDTDMEVNAVYESGNRKLLGKDEYTVVGGEAVAKLGKAYKIAVSYNENPALTLTADVIVRSTVQGEHGVIVGGGVKSENEFAVVDGVITDMKTSVSFAGDFAGSVKAGHEGSLTLTVVSESAVLANVTMRCGNSYCCYANGKDASAGYIMQPLQVNTILDLIVNGEVVAIPNSVVLKGSGPSGSYAPLFGIYYEFTFEGIALEPGANSIQVSFKNSTNGAVNLWGESPSSMNIDYINVDTLGSEVPENYEIAALELSANYQVGINQAINKIKPPVIAVLPDGTRILAPTELVDLQVTGGDPGEGLTKYGAYTVTATLKSNPAITVTKTFDIIGIRVLNASVELQGDRVYYIFSGNAWGYTAEDFMFFNEIGGKIIQYDTIVELDGSKFTFKIDVTDLTPDSPILWPHLKVKGNNYQGGNGDIKGNGLKFKDKQEVILNGQIYRIVREWDMPSLRVFEAPAD